MLVNKPFQDIITFTRASAATRINSLGVMESVAANVPRIDYDPITLAVRGLLVEEQRTNLLTYSSYSAAGAWVLSNITGTVGSNYFARGSTAAAYITKAAGSTIAVGSPASAQLKAKAGAASSKVGLRIQGSYPDRADAIFDLSTGTVVGSAGTNFSGISTSISPISDGYYLCSITATPGNTAVSNVVFGPTDSSTFAASWENVNLVASDAYIKDVQLEAGSFSTSFIPTTGAQATRAADVPNINTISSFYNGAEGTLFADGVTFDGLATDNPSICSIETDANNRISLRRANNISAAFFRIVSGGVNADAQSPANAWPISNRMKMAIAMKAGDGAIAYNGTAATIVSPSSTMPSVNKLAIGYGAAANYFNGWIKKIRYYPKRVTNSDLAFLSINGRLPGEAA